MKRILPGCAKALALLAVLSCAILPRHALALARNAPPAAINLQHTSWTARDGAPGMILSMTQSSDGWLWLGGPTGLYRFDGIQFEAFTPTNAALLNRNVSMVNALADGALWIGYRTGGASLLRNGQIRHYDERAGLPRRAVWGIEKDASGRLWAATAQGMYYLDGERWLAPAASWQLAGGWYKTLMRDRQGILWAQGDAGVYFLRPGEQRFTKAPVHSNTGVLFNLPDGSVVSWDALRSHFNQLSGATGASGDLPAWLRAPIDPTSLLFDRDGKLWAGFKDGIEYRSEREIARTTLAHGLSGRSVGTIFQDQEGNIWAATASGIDRFRASRLQRVTVPEAALGGAIAADDHGGAWIGAYHLAPGDSGQFKPARLWPEGREGWTDLLTGYSRGLDGVLWGSTYGVLRRIQGKDHRNIAFPADTSTVLAQGLLADQDGSVLVALRQHGLYRWKPRGGWEKTIYPGEVSALARSDAAGLWLGVYPSQVMHAEGLGWRSYGSQAGLNIGLVMALHLHGKQVWAGGDNGVALLDQGRFRQLEGVNGETFDGISGIVELDNGDLWLNASTGLFCIRSGEIARFRNAADYRVQYERLDQHDGLEGSAPRITPSPSMVLATDGRLWIVRSTGVYRLNPAEQLPAAPAHPVVIKTAGEPGESRPARDNTRFIAGTSALQIDYATPALAMPEKVRFRYRLDKVDADWQEVGARRSAYYSNLASGDYVFRVAASDYNGKWLDQQTTLRFSIAPAISETWWFKALCAALLLGFAYVAYQWHIARMARQMAERLQERVGERERIARELHDTLLQSVQGLILHIHAAVMNLPAKDSARLRLEQALQQADEVVGEGRERISELRGHDADLLNLPDAVLAAAARLRPEDANPVQLKLRGSPRRLAPTIYTEAMAIITEAMGNAYHHANATSIEVELLYGARELRCIVRDDGIGIAPHIMQHGGRGNHWGMRGMSERAARIKARLTLRSDTNRGTEWQLTLPAAIAYARGEGWKASLAVVFSREPIKEY